MIIDESRAGAPEDKIEVTPDMISAGTIAFVLSGYGDELDSISIEDVLPSVFRAMVKASCPDAQLQARMAECMLENARLRTQIEELRDELADAREVLVEMDKIVAQLRAGREAAHGPR